ncbi:MAG: hypothetical protein ABH827_07060 [bacterium]
MNKKYVYFLFFLFGIVAIVSLFFISRKPVIKKEVLVTQAPVHRMTIFIHGTFSSQMGLLSYSEVVRDKVKGTLYKKTQKKMRKDPSYYAGQPIQEKGLVSIIPTFDPAQIDNKKYAAYPLIKAYQMVTQEIQKTSSYKNNEINYYYTFGWSGLISQYQRRKEAVRLYNTLVEEVENFKKRGINPKITILTHSHGGNLCLNLGAIGFLLNSEKLISGGVFSDISDANESLEKMAEILKALSSKENTCSIKGQRHYDYLPVFKDLIIDELILLGTPVQPETQYFWSFPTFNKIYNVYSDADTVQEMDWVSTKKSSSDKRFIATSDNKKLMQIRVMYNRDLSRMFVRTGVPGSVVPPINQTINQVVTPRVMQSLTNTLTPDQGLQPLETEKAVSKTDSKVIAAKTVDSKNGVSGGKTKGLGMLLGTLVSYAKIIAGSKISQDPEHKELWFVAWENDKLQNQDNNTVQTLDILPTVIFVPSILASLDAYNSQDTKKLYAQKLYAQKLYAQKLYDVDVNFVINSDCLNIQLIKHQDNVVKQSVRLPWSIIEHIKQEVRKWRPEQIAK